eukprot:TRINITY_DN11743_c0_g1_i1.p1 TRINITY_DN11743_c0_g1~~TRINITY_DN11743_c0_g1_i1.p1  ORF type:complete len:282 (+),score=75.59 TRINITY_DN11743_c0_g1_i1:31-876(+)
MTSTAQKSKVRDFKAIVSDASDRIATDCLKKSNWDVNSAINYYYANYSDSSSYSSYHTTTKAKTGDKAKLGKVFEKYSVDKESKDSLTGACVGKYFTDLGLNPETDVIPIFGICWKLKCKSMGEIKKSEFVDGWAELGCDTLSAQQAHVKTIINSLKDKSTFREFYRWVFEYLKGDSERKTIDVDPAMEMMSTLLPNHFKLLPQWIEFLKSQKEKVKTMTKDVWEQVFDFARDVPSDLSSYDANEGAFPVLIDEFVEWVKKKKDKDSGKDKEKEEKTSKAT